MVMRFGDVHWYCFRGVGSEPDGKRPCVVVQADPLNRSAISTVIVAAITSNERVASMPGNVRLRKGEASLPRVSVVNVSQLRTIDRERIGERIGTLSSPSRELLRDGLRVVLGLAA